MSVCSRARAGSASSASTASRVVASTFGGAFASAAASAFRRSRTALSAASAGQASASASKRRRQLVLGDHLLVVGVPRIEGEQAPVVGAERGRRRERVGEHRADRPRRVHAERQHLAVADRVDLAGQARHLLALRVEEDHRRIAADVKAGADLLRPGAVAVDVDRNEAARALDEVLAVEERRLDLVARRAPLRAPVDEDRLVLALGDGEGGVDLAVAGGLLPGDAGRRSPRAPSRARRARRSTSALAAGAAGVSGALPQAATTSAASATAVA